MFFSKKDDEQKPFKPYNPMTDSGSSVVIKIISKTPLFSSVLISMVVFTLIGLIGKYTFLKQFNKINNLKEPYFAITLFGLKDIINGEQDVVLPSGILKKQPAMNTRYHKREQKFVTGTIAERICIGTYPS